MIYKSNCETISKKYQDLSPQDLGLLEGLKGVLFQKIWEPDHEFPVHVNRFAEFSWNDQDPSAHLATGDKNSQKIVKGDLTVFLYKDKQIEMKPSSCV